MRSRRLLCVVLIGSSTACESTDGLSQAAATLDEAPELILDCASLGGDLCQDDEQGPSLTKAPVPTAFWTAQLIVPGESAPIATVGEWGLSVARTTESGPVELSPVGTIFTMANVASGMPTPHHRVRIEGVTTLPHTPRKRYAMSYQINETAPWMPLCPDSSLAIALPGIFPTSGTFWRKDDTVSFACEGSAAVKAVKWGYWPSLEHWMHYAAAVRIARADYCGLGDSRTIQGTEIIYFDLDGIAANNAEEEEPESTLSGSTEDFFFEGAWAGYKIVSYVPGEEIRVPVGQTTCLSKLRWQSLPPNNGNTWCGYGMPDPRLARSQGKFCEDFGEPDATTGEITQSLKAHGALVFSASKMNERGLWTWTKGKRLLVTSEGFWASRYLNDARNVFPRSFKWPTDKAGPDWVAAIQRYPKDGTVPLYLYKHRLTADRYETTTSGPSAMPQFDQVETPLGYVYPDATLVPSEFRPVPLYQYVRRDVAGQVVERVLQNDLWAAEHPTFERADDPIAYGFDGWPPGTEPDSN